MCLSALVTVLSFYSVDLGLRWNGRMTVFIPWSSTVPLCPRISVSVTSVPTTTSAADPSNSSKRLRTKALLPGIPPLKTSGPLCRAFECLLQIARPSDLIRGVLAKPSRTAVYGPSVTTGECSLGIRAKFTLSTVSLRDCTKSSPSRRTQSFRVLVSLGTG